MSNAKQCVEEVNADNFGSRGFCAFGEHKHRVPGHRMSYNPFAANAAIRHRVERLDELIGAELRAEISAGLARTGHPTAANAGSVLPAATAHALVGRFEARLIY